MGIFDTIKSRLSGGDQGEYIDDDEYYDNEEYYDDQYEDPYEDQGYSDDAGDITRGASSRRASVFDDYTPLVSMSDVRSQELPRYDPTSPASSAAPARQSASTEIRTSLPFIGDPAETLASYRDDEEASLSTGQLRAVEQDRISMYAADDSPDALLKRHSLSNTGDFSATSPAYYASRSGVGHVRPSGQPRKTNKFREVIVVNPATYADAEQVATNLRRGNAVILVLRQTRPELAKRILDFSFGAAAVSEGQVKSIGERMYALTCDYSLTDNEMELLRARGIL